MSEWNGVLLVDKPVDMTSHDVVGKARRVFETRAVGHCGTLDPMASGLLILLLGNATKLSDYLLTQNKTYLTTVKLGLTTDSYDITGEVTSEKLVDVSRESILKAIEELTGDVEMEIPAYSAKKVKGKKLYELAREGKEFELPKKIMSFFDVQVVDADSDHVSVQLSCSKGSFIRAWGHELGQKLDVGGCLSALRRLGSEPFDVNSAISLEELVEKKDSKGAALTPEDLGNSFLPSAQALPHLKMLVADQKEQKLLSNGQIPHSISSRLIFEVKQAQKTREIQDVKVLGKDQNLLAILQATPDRGLKIRRVFKN